DGVDCGLGGDYIEAHKSNQLILREVSSVKTSSAEVKKVCGITRWKIMNTGGGLRRWQIDCYFGEDEPLGPDKLQGRPRATTFEYAYANARIVNLREPVYGLSACPW